MPAFGMEASIDQPWQSGELQDYAAVLLDWPCLGVMLPLVAFSMACLTFYVCRPSTGQLPVIQIGLFCGAILALQYLILILGTTAYFTFFAAILAGPFIAVVVFGCVRGRHLIRRFTIQHLLILTTVLAVLISLSVTFGWWERPPEWLEVFSGLVFMVVGATPTLNLITYARAAIQVADRHHPFVSPTRSLVLGLIGWFVAWMISIRLSTTVMMTEYEKLPLTNPNCYVSSAAASGHEWLVRSERTSCGIVNAQMRRLKFLEFALAAAFPRTHRWIRRNYNRIGPRMAGCCRCNVWFADATYVCLKPLEWIAITLQIALRIPKIRIKRLYK